MKINLIHVTLVIFFKLSNCLIVLGYYQKDEKIFIFQFLYFLAFSTNVINLLILLHIVVNIVANASYKMHLPIKAESKILECKFNVLF